MEKYRNKSPAEALKVLEGVLWEEILAYARHFGLELTQEGVEEIKTGLTNFVTEDVKPAVATADEAEARRDSWDRSQMLALRNAD
jgi:hypothetical protein